MGLPDLYPAQVGSPYTTLSAPYTTGATTMTVVDATKLPNAPNIVCLAGSVSGEFRYTGKDGNTLLGVVKLPGTPNATWSAGTYAFRGVSAYDHTSIVEHLTYQRSHIVEASLDLTTNLTYSGRVLEGAEAGENLAFGDLAVLAESGTFVKANPATLATLDGTIALVVSDTIAVGSQGMFLLRGLIRNDSWTFSQGKELYASSGTLTHEPPTTGTQIIRKVGTALTATIIEFNPSSTLHAEYLVSVLPVNTVTKDNNDIERKFFKDDFSVDSSSQYTTTGTGTVTGWGTGVINATRPSTIRTGRTIINQFFRICAQMIGGVYDSYYVIRVGAPNNVKVIVQNRNGYLRVDVYDYTAFTSILSVNHPLNGYEAYHYVTVGFVNGKYVIVKPDGTETASSIITNPAQIPTTPVQVETYSTPLNISEMSFIPTTAYSDDFTTDTTERYQAVTGTVAYDDVNKRMNVTTAEGANGKASGRLKSYKFCEGSQIYDVLLPTGADGDFICLATHSANGLMTDGIGVGLQSDGAGNWNLATLSGTTVTEGADSGLDDGDVARIEIEKDDKGCYWYYIYDASGVKPTTPTGKLFTTLSEGYTGWYANGNSKTYAIDNISIRAESIVGRTNIEKEEAFWFRDDFGEDSRGRYVTAYGSIAGGKLTISGYKFYCTFPQIISGSASVETKVVDFVNSTWASIILFSQVKSGTPIRSGYKLEAYDTSVRLLKDTEIIQTVNNVIPGLTEVTLRLEFDSVTNTVTGYVNGATVITYVDEAPYTSGYACLGTYSIFNPIGFDYFEVSGTRVYQKPIHRGAMLETYHDGTQEVVGTTFIDDCQWDRSAEWTGDVASFTRNTTNGRITIAATQKQITSNAGKFGEGIYTFDYHPEAATTIAGLIIGSQTQDSGSMLVGNKYIIYLHHSNGIYIYKYVDGVSTTLKTTPYTFTNGTTYRFVVTWFAGLIEVYINGVLTSTAPADTTFTEGYFGFGTNSSGQISLSNITVIAASSDASNGIAACIPPIGGGARYGVEESVYIPITPGTEIPVGSAVISPNAKSTVVGTTLTTFAQTPAGVSASLEYATGTKACPGLSDALAPAGRHRVKADRNTLTNIGVKGSVAGTSPTVYIDSLHVRKQEAA